MIMILKKSQHLYHTLTLITDKYEIKVGDVEKLVPNLGNKTIYVVHYRIFSCICLYE